MVTTTVRVSGKAGVMRVREEKGQPYCARSFAERAAVRWRQIRGLGQAREDGDRAVEAATVAL
jgi:hypothetical protein